TRMDAVASVSHGTTIATNQLLEGDVGRLGFITSEGFEFILEIARQSVPDGYGNSYFWVKPDRIVPPDLVKTVGGRMDHTGAERLEQVAGTDGGRRRQRGALSRQTETPGQRTRPADTGVGGPPLHVMTSSGGVVTAEQVIGQPISTVLSGPAAGAVGAAMIA